MYKKILLPINLQESDTTKKCVDTAIEIAHRDSAEIHVLTVLPGFGMPVVASFFPDDAVQKALKGVAKGLKKYVANTFPDDLSVMAKISEGDPASRITSHAKKIKADLIIIPSRTDCLTSVFLGPCTNMVVSEAPCSVLVVKE